MNRMSMIIFFMIMLSIYGGANYYIARKVYQWLILVFPYLNVRLYVCIYLFFALSMIITFLPLPPIVKNWFSWISAHWMGVFVYLLLFIFIAHLIVFIGTQINLIPKPVPNTVHFYTGLTVFVLTVSIVTYGLFNATQIKHVSYEIQMQELRLKNEMKIVLISDLHLGALNSEERLENIVQNINKLEPDIVCIAGDIFNDDFKVIQNPEKAIDLLKSLKTKYGVFASLGNHDGGRTFEDMVRFLERSKITLLNDDHVIINDEVILIGRVDPSPIGGFGGLQRKDIHHIIHSIEADHLPIIVMDHTPIHLEQYDGIANLVLSGHTHRGQIFPGNVITNAIYEVDYGYYQKNQMSPHVIVSSGVGTWGMPMRVGTNNEIVTIYLR